MGHVPVRFAIVILRDENGSERPGQSQSHNEVDDSWESPPINHLEVLIHIDSAVDR